tara:strand:+ start:221 stop:661 length:441 start_codon:yes stop_codon:yes gene_type:complete
MSKHISINKCIFDVFSDYLKTHIIELLDVVATKYGTTYGFSKEDLIEEFLSNKEILLPLITTTKCLQKSKKKNKIKNVRVKQKCIARTWSNGKGLQCSRNAMNKRFCKLHQNQFDSKGFLWQGTILDEDNKVSIIYNRNKCEKKNK